jgi:hypothetical protein
VEDLPNNILNIPNVSNSFDESAFDEALTSHGVLFEHHRAMRSPLGMSDVFDSRNSQDSHAPNVSNGMIYSCGGLMYGTLISNSRDVRASDGGMLNSSMAQITVTRFYQDTKKKVLLNPFDRLYISNKDIVVTNHELVRSHELGLDRLRFPAVEVQDLIDSTGRVYKEGTEFVVKDGNICWNSGYPGYDAKLDTGIVYAIRYLYRPYFIVDRLLHELRIAQIEDIYTGQRQVTQMNQSALLMREHVFRNQENDSLAADPSQRQAAAPESGGFGER